MGVKCVILSLACVVVSLSSAAVDDSTDELTLSLIQKVESLENILKLQDKQLRLLERQVDTQDQEITDLKHRVTDEEEKQLADTDLARETRAANRLHVAFSAYVDHKLTHVGLQAIIPFNQTVLNDGGAYNRHTGVFTVPVSGVYVFTYMVNTVNTVWQLVVKLVVDGVNISDATSDPKHDMQEIQGGNTVIVHVNSGQSVWLAAYNTADTIVFGSPTHRFSTFSGFLLYA